MSRTIWEIGDGNPPSIWVGSLDMGAKGKPIWGSKAPKKLRRAMERDGRPFVLVGRNSASSGRRGCVKAATDLHEAAERLAELLGVDFRPVLPPIKVLAEALFTRGQVQRSVSRALLSPKSKERVDVPFVNRYLAIYLPEVNLIISLSAGTSVKLDKDRVQPHAHWWLRRIVDEVEPTIAGMFAKRLDRITRSKHGHTGLYVLLEDLAKDDYLWVGDGDMKRWKFDEDGFYSRLTTRAEGAEKAASELAGKSRQSMRRLTDKTMVEGRLSCPRGSLCPPGLFRYRSNQEVTVRSIMTLDHPAFYPESRHSLTPLPDVRDSSGLGVNQVALTIEALEGLASPGTSSLVDIFVDLAERGLSTHKWRERHGQQARFLGPGIDDSRAVADRARMYYRLLEKHLPVYEFGVMEVDLGKGEIVEVQNVLPPGDKPGEFLKSWVPREYFDDIRATLAGFRGEQWRTTKHIQLSWSGLPVTLDGTPAVMRPVERTSLQVEEAGPGVDWQVQPLDIEQRPSGFRRPRVADTAFTASLVEALFGADLTCLEPVMPSKNSMSERAALTLQRDTLRAEADEIRATQQRLAKAVATLQVTVKKRAGKSASSSLDVLLTQMLETDEQWNENQAELAVVERRVLAASEMPSITVPELDLLVAGLRNPEVNGYRNLLRRGIKDLRFAEKRVRVKAMTGVETSWEGSLVLERPGSSGSPSSLVELPFSGSVVIGNVVHVQERVAHTAQLLRAGEVVRNSESSVKYMKGMVAKAFGMQGRFVPALCGDPMLTRMWMALLCPQPAPGETLPIPTIDEIAAEPAVMKRFGGPEAVERLVERMQSLAASKPRTWRVPRGDLETRLVLEASRWRADVKARGNSADVAELPVLDEGGLVDVAALKMNVRQDRAHRWTFARGRMALFAPCEFCGHDVATLLRNIEANGYVCLGCRRDETGVVWDAAFDVLMAGVPLLVAAGYDLAVPDGHDDADVVVGTSIAVVEAKPAHYREYEDLDKSERAAIVGAYAEGVSTYLIRKEHRVTQKAMMRCVDEAGLRRRRPDIKPRVRDAQDKPGQSPSSDESAA